MPRPAGRRWARLRSGGSRATQVFARVTRRHGEPGAVAFGTSATELVFPQRPRSWRRLAGRRQPLDAMLAQEVTLGPDGTLVSGAALDRTAPAGVDPMQFAAIAPVSPAVGPATLPGPATLLGPATLPGPAPATIPLLPGERTFGRRVKFAIANGCTVASLLLGLTAIFLALSGELRFAGLALLACVVFDGCDGGLARAFRVASPFGAQMDSLADLSSFGVATGLVVHLWLVSQGASPVAAGIACATIVVCAAIRLARFNVSPKNGQFFSGVPTTMVAAVLALNILIGPDLPPSMLVAGVVVYALSMVTSFPYAKLVSVARLPLWLAVFPAICAMISVPATFTAIVSAYLISGPLLWIYQHRRPALAG
ncbi:MAG TPA: CDP-alcohol phosphatidyltransferase family protein [Micromonosporaceae bacterium]